MSAGPPPVHDFVAVGVGPFNLGLAALTAPVPDLSGVFLEQRGSFAWHHGMMLPDATIQVPFLADLVTMADPTSPYSFLAYLKQAGRLYPFYIRESFHPLRSEYDAYCRWVAGRVPGLRFGRRVERVEHDGTLYRVHARDVRTGAEEVHLGRRLVLGTGTSPWRPEPARDLPGPAWHTSSYLQHKDELQALGSVTVVGSGQSAAEVYLDLLTDADRLGYRVDWVTRSPRFFPMEYTKLTLEMTSPDYVRYHHGLPMERRDALAREQRHLYKGISGDLVDTIYDTLYRLGARGQVPTTLLAGVSLEAAAWDGDGYDLTLHHAEQARTVAHRTAGLVLATGYRASVPSFLDPVRHRLRFDARGRYDVALGYTVDHEDREVFVQNAEEHTHGLTAPDLGMGAFRSATIVNAMCGREVYAVERDIAYQTFGVAGLPAAGGGGADGSVGDLADLTTAGASPVSAAAPGDRAVWSVATPVGTLTVAPVDLDADAGRLHTWVTHPRSAFWSMQGQDAAQVRTAYAAIDADAHHDAWLVRRDGVACALVETYDPAERELVGHWDAEPGDVGMHVLVAPPAEAALVVHGLTSAVMATAVGFTLSRPGARRVVVEPDQRNTAVRAKNVAAGFVEQGPLDLGRKTAMLSTCTAEAFAASELGHLLGWDLLGAGHLEPAAMARAHRHLVTKALSELAHERLLQPEPVDGEPDAGGRTSWRVLTEAGRVTYTFRARLLPLEHWDVDPASVLRTVDGTATDLDALVLVDELQQVLGIPDHLLGTYLEEVAATLAGAAWKDTHRRVDARALARADMQTVERSMTEGHPAFVANNGRIGFGLADQAAYTPESGAPVRLVWLAARRDRSHLACGAGVQEDVLYEEQLGADLLGRFAARLRALGLDPAGYRWLPVHPWQWEHRLAVTFAADVARRDLVPVGLSDDRYQAQQSIRTFFDVDRPERHYVKTALAIQNMGFLRGLSPAYMRPTPAINDWVAEVVRGDEALRADGFDVLREVASVGYTGDAYHRAAARGTRSAQQRMVAALWRESPVGRLEPGERAMTMAALLHRDHEGRSLLGALVEGSGLDAGSWWQRYLHAYLRPLVHCLLVHDLAFMPHGENVILVLRDDVVVRVLLKDIGEEVAVFGDRPLPEGVERVRVDHDDDVRLLSVFTDVFDGVLRYAVTVLDTDGLLGAEEAWRLVAGCLARHREEHPDLHRRFDLFAPTFGHSCLNRLQLRNTLQMVDLADQVSSLQLAGELDNPVAAHRPAPVPT